MLPQAVRAVVFDVVGTLVEPWPAVPVAYRDAARRHGIERDVDEIRGRFAAAWKKQESIDAAATPAHVTSPAREEARWRSIVADVFESHVAADAIFADLWDHFGRPEAWRPLSRGRDLVSQAHFLQVADRAGGQAVAARLVAGKYGLVQHDDVGTGLGGLPGGRRARWPTTGDYQVEMLRHAH